MTTPKNPPKWYLKINPSPNGEEALVVLTYRTLAFPGEKNDHGLNPDLPYILQVVIRPDKTCEVYDNIKDGNRVPASEAFGISLSFLEEMGMPRIDPQFLKSMSFFVVEPKPIEYAMQEKPAK